MAPKGRNNDRGAHPAGGARGAGGAVPIGDRDEVLGAPDLSGDSGGDRVARSEVGSGLSEKGAEAIGSPTQRLIESLPEGARSLLQVNEALTSRLAEGPLELTIESVLRAHVLATEGSLLYIATLVLSALAQMDALPLGYETSLENAGIGLDHIKLRALYDVISGGTE